ncbi:ABC transporter ATP-binding protein [Anoxynatronum sibiricum]|uniref:ABC transporter ATP-binding protein n=1 Tax=Anoxynatronum sibiricum TaxID=210623 RepID=A0ABU9VXJ5_9CLOT
MSETVSSLTKEATGYEKEFSSKSSRVLLKQLMKRFPSHEGGDPVVAVNNIDLEIKTGELTTLLGPSGCGKTTTLRMVAGFEIPTSGEIYLGDENVVTKAPNKRDIAMVFQSYALFPHLSVYENILYGLKLKRMTKEQMHDKASKVVELMQLEPMKNRFPNQISGGQQQRVALARAIVIEPRVLLFDEPLSNLDAKLREYMRDELRKLQRRLGITSLYVTHDQGEAMAISDKVVIMNSGYIEQMGTPQEIYEYPASRFVANFIGKSNFMTGNIAAREEEAYVVNVKNESMKIPNPGKQRFQVGDQVYLAVRPESIHLTSCDGQMAGEVTKAVYFGARMEYEVLVNSETLFVEDYNPQKNGMFHEGDRVNVQFDLPSVRLLQD